MGEAKLRKMARAAGVGDQASSAAVRGPWWHGTDAQFHEWVIPPPRKADSTPLDMPHKFLFFTQERDYALGAGSRLCQVQVRPEAKVLTPGEASTGSRKLRQSLLTHPNARLFASLRSEEAWRVSWTDGTALRFAAEQHVVQEFIAKVAKGYADKYPGLAPEAYAWAASQSITRGWIELISDHALSLGYDAIQGRELDSKSGPGASRSWMAVLRAEAITPPDWAAA